jgi:hypothetical protein
MAIHYLSASSEKGLGPSSSIKQQHYNIENPYAVSEKLNADGNFWIEEEDMSRQIKNMLAVQLTLTHSHIASTHDLQYVFTSGIPCT